MLIVGDLHITHNRQFAYIEQDGSNSWVNIGINCLKEVLDKGRELDCPIVFLGDIFDSKDRIPSYVLNAFYDEITAYPKDKDIYILVGNHDYLMKDNPTYKILDKFENIHIVDKASVFEIEDVLHNFIPFIRDEKQFIENIKKFNKTDDIEKDSILFLHQDINGAKYSESISVENTIKEDLFKNWNKVISGHIHIPQKLKKVEYVGSLYNMDFGTDYEPHFIELTDNKIKYHVCKNSPKFLVLDNIKPEEILNELKKLKLKEINFLKIKESLTSGELLDFNVREIRKSILENYPQIKAIKFDINKIGNSKIIKEREVLVKNSKNYNDVISKYVKFKGTPKEEIKIITEIGKNLFNEI